MPFTKHPKSFFWFFAVMVVYMATQSTIGSLIFLYLHQELRVGTTNSYALIAAFASLLFLSAIYGGYIGKRWGYWSAMLASPIFSILSFLSLGLHKAGLVDIGLALFIFSNGLLLPNLMFCVGHLFSEKSANRNLGFTLIYLGMNVGALLGSTFNGLLSRTIGYSYTFLLMAILPLVMALLILQAVKSARCHHEFIKLNITFNRISFLKILLTSGILTLIATQLLHYPAFSNEAVLMVFVISAAAFWIIAGRYKAIEKKNIYLFITFTAVSIIFWGLYNLSPSAFTEFIQEHVNRQVVGINIPTPVYYALNPIFCIVIGIILVFVKADWLRKNTTRNIFVKLALGLILIGLGYALLYPAIIMFGYHNQVSSGWVALSYFLQSAAEMLIAPLGYALVGQLVPKAFESTAQGFWILATGSGAAVSSYFAISTYINNRNLYSQFIAFGHAFLYLGIIAAILGVGVFVARNLKGVLYKSKAAVFNLQTSLCAFTFSRILVSSILVLYFIEYLHLSRKEAFLLFATYYSLLSFVSIFSGFLGDKFGHRMTITVGAVLGLIGLWGIIDHRIIVGLTLFTVGESTFKPNYYTIIGRKYESVRQRRDMVFLSYLASNVGALFAGFGSGYIVRGLNYTGAFIAIGASIVVSLFFFWFSTLKGTGQQLPLITHHKKHYLKFAGLILILLVCVFLLLHAHIYTPIILLLGAPIVVILLGRTYWKRGHKKQILLFLALAILNIIFWAFYFLEPSALMVFIKHNVDRVVLGHSIPPQSFSGFNCIFNLMIGAVVVLFLGKTAIRNKFNLSFTSKMWLGFAAMLISMLILYFGCWYAGSNNLVGLWWVLLALFMVAGGETLVLPATKSALLEYTPSKNHGTFQGMTEFACGTGAALSGYLALATCFQVDTPAVTMPLYQKAFGLYAILAVLCMIAVIAIARLKRGVPRATPN